MGRGRGRWVALALVSALVGGACSIAGGGSEGYRVTTYFGRAVSLFPHSDVRILGLPAGTVTDVRAEGDRVRVVLEINKDVPVPADVQATIIPLSLIGERYVQLFPAWKEGQPRLKGGAVIPLDRTTVPVEPDEALAALKEFLEKLDPNATGRLVRSLGDSLEGVGPQLNEALEGLGTITATLASKDEELGRIIEQFDRFAATVRTRESQLGLVMDDFAQLTSLLAEERRSIEDLVRSLGRLSTDALTLVAEHRQRLDQDLTVLTRTLQSVKANLQGVRDLIDAGPPNVTGLFNAYDPVYKRVDTKTSFAPLAQAATEPVFDPLGIPIGDPLCVPIDVTCQAPSGAGSTGSLPVNPAPPVSAPPAANATVAGPATTSVTAATGTTVVPSDPLDDILGLLGGDRAHRSGVIAPRRSTAERLVRAAGGAGGFLRRAAGSLLGAL
jgi:phospholipid/cholesterol/gamma-HCH transport system substrate-binding protein